MWGKVPSSIKSGKSNQTAHINNQRVHPFSATLSKATKFTLPWVRDDTKKPGSGGRGSSVNIDDLTKPIETTERPFTGRTSFKYQKPPVVIPFISLKNFKKTTDNMVAPATEPDKTRLKKQQSELIQNLTTKTTQQGQTTAGATTATSAFTQQFPGAPPQLNDEETDVSDLLDELESVKLKYQEGLKKKIENEALANRREFDSPYERSNAYSRLDSHEEEEEMGGSGEEAIVREMEKRLEMGDFTVLFDQSNFQSIEKLRGVITPGNKIALTEEEVKVFEEIFEEDIAPEMKELHKEELYNLHLAMKEVLKEKDQLGNKSRKYKKLRSRVAAKRKQWQEEELAESLKELEENGWVSVDAMKRDAARIALNRFNTPYPLPDVFQPFFDETAVGVSLAPTFSLRRKVSTLVYALVQFATFASAHPEYDNDAQLLAEEEELRLKMESFVADAEKARNIAFNYEKTGQLQIEPDENENTTRQSV